MLNWEYKKITLENKYFYSVLYHEGSNNRNIIFLHGLGSAKEDFLVAINYSDLRKYNLLTLDLIGHGKSIKPQEFSFSMIDQAKNIVLLLKKLSFEDNLIIVAHSMGGPIAILLAELLPNKPLAIIYAEGNIDFNDCFGSNAIISSGSLENWEEINFRKTLQKLKEEENFNISNYALNFEKAGAKTTYLSSMDLVKISKENILVQKLINLEIPVLPLFGERNKGKFTSEKKLKEYFQIKYISNSGHDMLLSNPTEFYQVIFEFIKKLD
ncbi:MAG: alpha/beta hydrolase [Candidatus Heimdallarchaeota archaeon]|nr:alpha/beta hydrolase [Candidatus Heimdallarchaeota archaeon]